MRPRVVITGVGAVSCLGIGAQTLLKALEAGRSGIARMEDYAAVTGLRCQVGGPAPVVECRELPRHRRRSMTRMSLFAAAAGIEKGMPVTWPESIGSNFNRLITVPFGTLKLMKNLPAEYPLSK